MTSDETVQQTPYGGHFTFTPQERGIAVILKDWMEHAMSCTGDGCERCATEREARERFDREHPNYCSECGRWDDMESDAI
jgi:hypothetical protein